MMHHHKGKQPSHEPVDTMLLTFGKVLYGDRAWQEGLARFFDVHVNTVYNWVYGVNEAPKTRYSLLLAEVRRRQLAGDLP